jgi:hypothetical protein
MAVIKEWSCAKHGEFEGSHAICPFQPCDSAEVMQEFRTAPKIRSQMVSRHEQGLKRSAEIYGLSDFRTCREGEVSKPPHESEYGTNLMWGAESREKLGPQFSPVLPDGGQRAQLGGLGNNGMAAAAEAVGITGLTAKALPPSFDTTYAKGDTAGAASAQRLLPKGMTGKTHRARGRI